MDTNIELSLSKKMVFKKCSNVRFAQANDEIAVRSIAKNAFKYDRFQRDQIFLARLQLISKKNGQVTFFQESVVNGWW